MMISMATAPSLSHGFKPQNMVNYHVISQKKSMVDQFTIIFQVFFDHWRVCIPPFSDTNTHTHNVHMCPCVWRLTNGDPRSGDQAGTKQCSEANGSPNLNDQKLQQKNYMGMEVIITFNTTIWGHGHHHLYPCIYSYGFNGALLPYQLMECCIEATTVVSPLKSTLVAHAFTTPWALSLEGLPSEKH